MPPTTPSPSVTASDWAAAASQSPAGFRAYLGAILVRLIIPIWVLVGAGFKLVTLNPNVLPRPVRDSVMWMNSALGTELRQFLDLSYRSMVAVELVAVGLMLFVPRLARPVAIAILMIFCLVLVADIAMILTSKDFERKGIRALLEPCGCFGAASPPTILTFAIDATLLLGALLCAPKGVARSLPRWPASGVLAVASVVVGTGLAFGVPAKTITVSPPPSDDGTTPPAVVTETPAPVGQTATSPAWPAAPTTLRGSYLIDEQAALGTRIDQQELAILINRPLPGDLTKGRWHLVFYRKDCEHCHELLETYFAKELPAPTLAIAMPDSTGTALDMPCSKCAQHTLPKGPSYIVTAPLLMTIQDGIIVGITLDTDKPGAVKAVLSAGTPEAKSVPGALIHVAPTTAPPTTPTPTPTAPPAQPQAAASTTPFPAMPTTLESFYAPEFEKWPGKRFDSDPFAVLLQRPLPFDPNSGKVVIVYYRADCEHCHTLLADHFSSKLPAPTIAVAIPDSDPAAALEMPCDQCKLSTVPAGPIYVIETPVIVVLENGIVKGWIGGSAAEDPTAVEQLLGTGGAR